VQRPTALSISAASVLWVAACSAAPLAHGVSLTIDGKKQDIRGSVSCSSHAGGDAIRVGELPDGIYVHVAPQNSGVEELKLGNSTGKSLIAHAAEVSLEPDGTYDFTGQAVPEDTKDSNAPKPFELKIKCP
jgi:Mycobacterium 19 kDa lipoprotein antigen